MKKVTFTLDDLTLERLKLIKFYSCNAASSAIVREAIYKYYLWVRDLYENDEDAYAGSGAGAEPQIGGKAQDAP